MIILRDIALLAIPAALSGLLAAAVVPAGRFGGDERAALSKLVEDGNFKDAYQGYRRLALSPNSDPRRVGEDLTQAIHCLRRLNRVAEIDAFREAVIEVHAESWRLLWAAAQSYVSVDHFGVLVAGQFERGRRQGGGQVVSSLQRDRARALQLFQKAMPLTADDPDRNEVGRFYLSLAQTLLGDRGYREAWRLQYLTDLDHLPDYQSGQYLRGGRPQGAPVDVQGTPVFYTPSRRWQDAGNDGQRWRLALSLAAEAAPGYLNRTRFELADFLHHQFGVQTLADYRSLFGRLPRSDRERDQSGTYALHTLTENETIARLAIGIRRFSLPDAMNFIRLYRQIVDDDPTGYGQQAITKLAQIFENRRHYPLAAAAWRENIEKYGDQKEKRQRLDQIIGAWGQFEAVMTQPAETGATVEYRFRNGHKVVLTAHRIRVDRLLADVQAYLKDQPKKLDWNQLNLGNLGHRLVYQHQRQYVGKQVAQWELELTPREGHFDERITMTTPLREAGAYLVTAKMADGNTSSIVLWVSDTAIVKKPMAGKALYYVADAVTGRPIPKARVTWFGYWQEHLGRNRFQVHTREFTGQTDASGLVVQEVDPKAPRYRWIATATTPDGRLAFLGFTGVWAARYDKTVYDRVKVFTITDRPVYRPRQTVQFKFWVRHAGYDQAETSQFADQTFQVEIRDPKGEKILNKAMTSDQYGGIAGSYDLPVDATLGVYRLQVVGRGGGQFRVEEYKKPEFEVTVDAPSEPALLGETITATVKARYYFGAPVTDAKVRIKVQRTSYTDAWFPPGRWDWLYGRGYWWFSDDYTWYPGWNEWGCRRPTPWWWWHSPAPPELVMEQELAIRPDGTVTVEIDTALAGEIHPDQDHRYQITAEVIDPSRRTIVGSGEVLVGRKPFQVCAWVGRGYYRVGEVVDAHFAARTLDKKPVKGEGKVTLLRIQYDQDRQPVETPVRTWDLDTNSQGAAELRIKASAKGQYRLDYQLTDAGGHTLRGGYVFTIIGAGFDGAEFRFNDLELIADKREYAPGEPVKLQINTNRVGATVLLFARPAGGVYLPPQVVRMTGKSTVVDVEIAEQDMPNFFIEAVTVARGQVFRVTREVHVPPERRVLGVEVVASSPAYQPGQKAHVTLRLTDAAGKPFVGSTVLAVYDKAVEYISGGSNVPKIQEFFWKWRRHHRPRRESNLDRRQLNLAEPNQPTMASLGLFGGTVADELGPAAQLADGRNDVQYGVRRMARGAGVAQALAAPEGAAPAPGAGIGGGGDLAGVEAKAAGGDARPVVQPTLRTRFADTALWKAALTTNEAGLAEVHFELPDSLTTWKVKAWAMGPGTKVGEGETEVITRKDVLVRMQAPRFFLETDRVVLSANVHNYLDHDKQVDVVLELDGETLKPTDAPRRTIHVPASGQVRVDWHVTVVREGEATVRMKALTDAASDAMEMHFPVAVHGMHRMESFSGALRPSDARGSLQIEVPDRRRVEQSHLEVRFTPTLAGAMVDCLPYLVDYPYGCTEQTLNRFLPTVITQKILLDMQLDLATIRQKRTNLNAQEIGADRQRARQWKRDGQNPVFDEAEVRRMAAEGIKALAQMQLADGGWGWFSGWGERSHPHTTALVVHGLQIAQHNDVAVPPQMLKRGIAWLTLYQDRQVVRLRNAKSKTKPQKQHADNIDALVHMVLVDAGVKNQAMTDSLYRDRKHLSVYGKALFGLALNRQGAREQLAMILRNIGQYVVQDDTNQTAYLNLPGGDWWYWYGSQYEAHAYYLKLLAATEPKGQTAARLVKYLLNNRKHATYWNSTRDTALVIEAMADYLKASGENRPDMVVQVWLDGKLRKEVKITPQNLFTFDNQFVLDGEAVETGMHTVELRRQGTGPLYYNAYLSNFTLEPHIRQAGLELKVERKYFKLAPEEKTAKVAGSRGQAVDQAVPKYRRIELPNLATVESGDLVEIELTVASKNDYEYIILEDMKAAGFEPVTLRSGYTANALGAYVELRDNRAVLFVRRLPRGRHSVSYRMRAEIPGQFSALPTRVYAMYAPELKGNSDEIKLKIVDVPVER